MAEAKKVYRKNKKNGVTYIYLDEPYWDSEKKIGRHRMKCIGKLDACGNEVLNKSCKTSLEADLPPAISRTERLGERMVLQKVSSSIGLGKVLRKAFGKEKGDVLEALAMFESCTGDPVYLAAGWCAEHGMAGDFSSPSTSKLLASIGQDELNTFFNYWFQENGSTRGLLFDITSISSYARLIDQVEWGHNRDGERLEQVVLSLVCSYGNGIPLWFCIHEGSSGDTSQLRLLLETLKKLGVNSVVITADRGFYSDDNIRRIVDEGAKFILPVPSSVSWQRKLIGSVKENIYSPQNLVVYNDGDDSSIIYAVTKYDASSPYGRVWKHIYYDAARKEKSIADLMSRINRCRLTLAAGGKLPTSDDKFAETYLKVTETPKRGRKVAVNDAAIKDFISSDAGYWVILTNCEKDAASALESYRRRNAVEILFDDFKNTLDGDRTRSHSPQTMLGRLIVIFLSTILVSQLRRTVEAIPGKDRRWWNWKEFLRHAASYSKCHFAGKYNDVYTSPTKGQRMIFNLLRIPYMWKGKKVSWADSEEVEKDAQTDESGTQDIDATAATDQT